MAALMLGIDFSETDLQLSLWNEERTCAEVYSLDNISVQEVIPLFVVALQDGSFLAGREALEYTKQEQKEGASALYGTDIPEVITLNGKQWTSGELLAGLLGRVFSEIRKRFGGASIARIGITGERMDEKGKKRLLRLFDGLGYPEEKLFFSSHADAFLWYEMSESGDQAGKLSMALDFDCRGMLSYTLHPREEGKEHPSYLEKTDYTEFMPSGLEKIQPEEERTECFSHVVGLALNRREPVRLYVTGRSVEQESITRILETFSSKNRRIFCGRSLYSLGVCCQAVKGKFTKPVISDGQLFHSVFLEAYQDGRSVLVPMAKAGMQKRCSMAVQQVILDETDRLSFRTADARTGAELAFTIQPDHFRPRENKTLRLEVTTYFLDERTLVVKLRDVGFGAISPASYRVWEQMISLE